MLSKVPGYIRSFRFKLLNHHPSAHMRALKGLPPRDGAVAEQEPPTWHAIHEFDDNFDIKVLIESVETEWSKKVFEVSIRSEYATYRIEKRYGNEEFFY